MGVDGDEIGGVVADPGVFEVGECGRGGGTVGAMKHDGGGGFGEEEAFAGFAEGEAAAGAIGLEGGEDAEALEAGFEEGMEGGVGGDDEGLLAFVVLEGAGGAVEGVEAGGAGGDAGVGGAGEVEMLGEEWGHAPTPRAMCSAWARVRGWWLRR